MLMSVNIKHGGKNIRNLLNIIFDASLFKRKTDTLKYKEF